MQELESLLY